MSDLGTGLKELADDIDDLSIPDPETDSLKKALKFETVIPNTFVQDMMRYLNRRVIGQEEAKMVLIGTLYQYLKYGDRSPLLLIGGTGCGKTHLIRTAMSWIEAKMPTVHFASRNVSRLTASGWSGEDFDSELCIFPTMRPGHHYIIHMDEIDKLMQPLHNAQGDDHNAATCGQLMNAISGEDQRLAGMDWSRVLVIATGAFEWLEGERVKAAMDNKSPIGFGEMAKDTKLTERELLERAGVMKELLGRFSCITHLDTLGEQAMMDILCLPASEGGLLEQKRDLYRQEGIRVVLETGARERIAARAVKDAHGARSISTILHELLGPGQLVNLKLMGRKTFRITGKEGEHVFKDGNMGISRR